MSSIFSNHFDKIDKKGIELREDIAIAILSAGKGTRMKSEKAKVLHEIGGKPMLHHIIKEAQKLSTDITVIVSHKKEDVENSVNLEFENIKFLTQDDKNFPGTGGTLRDFKTEKGKILILNGDMPLITSSDLEKFLLVDADIVMSLISLENPTGYGRVVQNGDEVLKIVEEKDCSPIEKEIKSVNGGLYLIKKEILNYLPKLSNINSQKEYYLTDIIELSKNDGLSVKGVEVSSNSFWGVNSKVDLAKAEEIYLKRVKESLMQNGVIMHLPDTIFIEGSVKFIGECEIEQNVTILGDTEIVNSTIKAGSVIESSYIENSTIGVMAHIRPSSHIVDSKVGNFVEVKKSKLKGVKAGHLSYLGDAEIGENTNIGAGVITANYDGKGKHKTKIGKNVFVGSDSQLIAPIEIPDDVMIGAGTTLPSKTVLNSGVLAISRGNVRILKDFYYKFFGNK
jgi:bifunctional UDP-N-acetylglucosamine pyrophosphorylase/glucosamine-1-phosphate N-acetyltransferase